MTKKYDTRDPFELCDALGILIHYQKMHKSVKAFYVYCLRVSNIVLNEGISHDFQRVLVAHELGHDREHRQLLRLNRIRNVAFYDPADVCETQANLFSAELLIEDEEILDMIRCDYSLSHIAHELRLPIQLLDFKLRILEHKGFPVKAPRVAASNFLANDFEGCYEDFEHSW